MFRATECEKWSLSTTLSDLSFTWSTNSSTTVSTGGSTASSRCLKSVQRPRCWPQKVLRLLRVAASRPSSRTEQRTCQRWARPVLSRTARRVRPKWGQTSSSTAKHTQRGGSSAGVLPFKRGESFLTPWFVCLQCVAPGPWCVGPACASGVWSCRLGLALWPRRPGPSPSCGLVPGPLVGAGRLALSSVVFQALFFLLFRKR